MPSAEAERNDRPRTIVTGGSSGLGAAVVADCRRAGHDVAVIDKQRADDSTIVADIADVEQARGSIATALQRLGGVDNVVLAAGINAPALAAEADPHRVADIVRVNLVGTIVAAGAAVPALEASGGRLVVIGSTVSRRGKEGQSAYAASKFGVAGLVESLGHELRGRVAVTLVSPGAIDTALFADRPARWMPDPSLMMTPETVSAAVMFALQQPPHVAVRELVITHVDAPDWP